MRVEVYDSEGEALDAAAEHVGAVLRAADTFPPLAALPGERRGRAFMTALAARDEVPWETTRWCVTHELVPPGPGDARSADLLRDEVVTPRRLAPEAVLVPDGGSEAAPVARAYGERLAGQLGGSGGLAVACVVLADDGSVAGLGRCNPGASDAAGLVLSGTGVVSLSAQALDAARALVVVATGASVSAAVSRLLSGDTAPAPDHPSVRPSERVFWFADRAAVAELLRSAQPVEV
jgi:6-phosphogluconolactonase/glucosamine-6-phosphate isomerase/deaminase